jgi:hypothetical protein
MRLVFFLVAGVLVAACSGGSSSDTASAGGSGFASQICSKIATCSTAPANCEAAFAALVLSSSCQQTFLSASCADLIAATVPPSLQGCIPTCSGTMSCGTGVTSTACNGNGTVTECINGSQYVYSCDGVCAAETKAYSGTCDLTYQGQTSPTSCPACWCK